MTGRVADAAPLRFLIAVVAVWTVGRGAVLLGWQPEDLPALLRPVLEADAGVAQAADPDRSLLGFRPASRRVPSLGGRPNARVARLEISRHPRQWLRPAPAPEATGFQRLADAGAARGPIYRDAVSIDEARTMAGETQRRPRWSGSAWGFVRGGGRATSLSPGSQIGGGQAGARVLYRLDDRGISAASGRLSRTLGGVAQSEAAIGIDIKPIAALPVHLMAERRVALDRGGRNAWTLGAAGGVYAVPLAAGWRLDAYAEAGVVGARRRDLYADGAARIARAIDFGAGRSLAIGGGVWAAAQPGAARFDAGPSIVLRLPIEDRTVAFALDWREQVAGTARPRSGIAFTTAVDF